MLYLIWKHVRQLFHLVSKKLAACFVSTSFYVVLNPFLILKSGFSGKRACKFQPKPKLGRGKEKPTTSNPQVEVRSPLPSPAVHSIPPDNGNEQEGSISEFPHEGILGYSSERFGDSIAVDPTPEIQGDAEPTNLAEATHSDGTVLVDMHSEDDPGMVGEVVTFSSKIISLLTMLIQLLWRLQGALGT